MVRNETIGLPYGVFEFLERMGVTSGRHRGGGMRFRDFVDHQEPVRKHGKLVQSRNKANLSRSIHFARDRANGRGAAIGVEPRGALAKLHGLWRVQW